MQEYPEQFAEIPEKPSASPLILLRRFLTALRRKWWIPIITVSLAVPAAIYYLSTQPELYVSSANMWVRGKVRISDVGQYTEDTANFFGTQIQLLQSDEIQRRAFQRLTSVHTNLVNELGDNLVIPQIRVSQARSSAVFNLESYSGNARLAQLYLETLMEVFLLYKAEIREEASRNAWGSVSKQAVNQESALNAAQDKLIQFQQQNNVPLLEEILRRGGSQLVELSSELAGLRTQLKLLGSSTNEVNSDTNSATGPLISIAEFSRLSGFSTNALPIPEELLAAQQRLQALQQERSQINQYLRPEHPKIAPKVAKLDEEIALAEDTVKSLKEAYLQELASAAREALAVRIQNHETNTIQLQTKVTEANTKMGELEGLRVDFQRKQSYYDQLLTLLQGVDLSTTMNQENVTILEHAGPAIESQKKPIPVIAAAILVGMLPGLAIIFLLARLDDRCESLNELKTQFVEPIFGQLPEVKGNHANGSLSLLKIDDDRHIFAESCRSLRSSLLYGIVNGEHPKTILVTSSAPGEGKSTVAANLACALALGGAKVLLVDADVRCGHVHKLIDIPAEPGLTDCLQQNGDWAIKALPSAISNLYVMPSGKSANGTTGELFLKPTFDQFIQHARQDYDYVLIDSIPVFAADDTTTLAPKMDAVLFVVRRGYTSARLAQEALELLYQRQAKILGIVFNRANSKSRRYQYYKYDKYYSAAAAKKEEAGSSERGAKG